MGWSIGKNIREKTRKILNMWVQLLKNDKFKMLNNELFVTVLISRTLLKNLHSYTYFYSPFLI